MPRRLVDVASRMPSGSRHPGERGWCHRREVLRPLSCPEVCLPLCGTVNCSLCNYCSERYAVGVTIGAVLRAARSVRGLSSTETARSAGISPAYLSRLENDAVKRPSPGVLHRLGEVLKVPYAELMTLVGYRIPDASDAPDPARLDATIFTDLTD